MHNSSRQLFWSTMIVGNNRLNCSAPLFYWLFGSSHNRVPHRGILMVSQDAKNTKTQFENLQTNMRLANQIYVILATPSTGANCAKLIFSKVAFGLRFGAVPVNVIFHIARPDSILRQLFSKVDSGLRLGSGSVHILLGPIQSCAMSGTFFSKIRFGSRFDNMIDIRLRAQQSQPS